MPTNSGSGVCNSTQEVSMKNRYLSVPLLALLCLCLVSLPSLADELDRFAGLKATST